MLQRLIQPTFRDLLRRSRAVVITGPRQSGKTTLAKTVTGGNGGLGYLSLETPWVQAKYRDNEAQLFQDFPNGAVIDEVQELPSILSALQEWIDSEARDGRWVLTGSRQMDLRSGVSQSLAGRASRLELWPFSRPEVAASEKVPPTLPASVLAGGYPALFDRDRELEPTRWLENYAKDFVQRDARALLAVDSPVDFDRFVRLCAARTGQLLNVASLAESVGISAKTAEAWITVLEACYLVIRLRPFERNFGKRMVKRAKLHFVDTGLACRLLQIQDVNQLQMHPLYGALVESYCVGEVIKARLNRGQEPRAWYWRSDDGIEFDLLLAIGPDLYPFEVKATATPNPSDLSAFEKLRQRAEREPDLKLQPGTVIYGGADPVPYRQDRFVPWHSITEAVPTQP